MHYSKSILAAIMISGAVFQACHKTEVTKLGGDGLSPTIINGKDYTTWQFIDNVSRECYFWESNIPKYLDYTKYDTPQDFFDQAIRYKDDHFSAITDNYSEMEEYFDNEIKTDGINMELFATADHHVLGVVNYVYDNTPAAREGIRRGCVIKAVNGQEMTIDNYDRLLDLDQCTYTYSQGMVDEDYNVNYDGGSLTTTKLITKEKCRIDPVLMVRSGEVNGRKYGYLVYDAFTESTGEIMNAIAELKKDDPTDLILDLRLNGGGYVSTLDTLASMLVPDGNVGKVFISTIFNKYMTDYYREIGGRDFATERFVEIAPKLQLQNIYVLMSRNTASASEELISGLSPYVNVIKIGENSYGKYTTNILLNNDMDGSDDNGIPYRSWAEYVTIGTCQNSLGEMEFSNGFAPDYEVFDPMCLQLGDESEPLLNQAIQLIGGSLAKKSTVSASRQYRYLGSRGKPGITRGAMIIRAKN